MKYSKNKKALLAKKRKKYIESYYDCMYPGNSRYLNYITNHTITIISKTEYKGRYFVLAKDDKSDIFNIYELIYDRGVYFNKLTPKRLNKEFVFFKSWLLRVSVDWYHKHEYFKYILRKDGSIDRKDTVLHAI